MYVHREAVRMAVADGFFSSTDCGVCSFKLDDGAIERGQSTPKIRVDETPAKFLANLWTNRLAMVFARFPLGHEAADFGQSLRRKKKLDQAAAQSDNVDEADSRPHCLAAT